MKKIKNKLRISKPKKNTVVKKTISKNSSKKRVVVSGGFDPIHIGHIRMIQEAGKLGDELVVILNNDNWLMKKKNFVFMPEHERKEVLEGLHGVHKVVITEHEENPEDMSVAKEIRKLKPHIFAQGGDRKDSKSIPSTETLVCDELGCSIIYNVGQGGKIQSSSVMAARLIENAINNNCPCKSGKPYTKCGMKNTEEHKNMLNKLLNG